MKTCDSVEEFCCKVENVFDALQVINKSENLDCHFQVRIRRDLINPDLTVH